MTSFVHSELLWGLLIVGVPVLIHLINMMRHRRVRWAAMEFSLVSQKKHRTWILLKQLLLLLMRMAAVALVVLIVAQPSLRNQLGQLFGATKTHHFVLLDDSFSMSDHWDDTSALGEAKAVVERIGSIAVRQAQPQTFTLLRFSQAGRASLGTHPDYLKETVSADFSSRLRRTLSNLKPSLTAAGPAPALDALKQVFDQSPGDRRIVYLITDFRARPWNEPGELRDRLVQLKASGAEVHLIQCVDSAHANLAITDLRPGPGTRAAGVPLFMEVTVQNFGPTPVRDVPVIVEADDQAQPAVRTGEIPPGKSVKERFPVYFASAGQHRITARLQSDAVAADNYRYAVVDFPASLPVLMIDGDAEARDAAYLSTALNPGRPVVTGVQPRIEKPRYSSLNALDSFRAIYLLNVDRLDPSGVEALEKYVAGGGGLGIFLGPRSSVKFLTESLYKGGKGLFPLPVSGEAALLVDRLQRAPDMEVGAHPIFTILSGKRNSFLAMVNVDRYLAAVKDWKPSPDSGVQVIARLRNGAPLAVERSFGEGRVVAFLTTAAPVWNNWARNNPSFPVAMLELQAYLTREPPETARRVGAPLVVKLNAAHYDPAVRFVTPGKDAPPPAVINASPGRDGSLVAALPSTEASGVYQARLRLKDGKEEIREFAVNVDPEEGDLRTVPGATLAQQFAGVAKCQPAAAFQSPGDGSGGGNLWQALLYALVALLIFEQILAWSASYHRSTRQPLGAAGGVA